MSPLDAAQGGVGMKWFGGWRLQIRFVPPPPVTYRPPGWRPDRVMDEFMSEDAPVTWPRHSLADEDAVFSRNVFDKLRGTPRKMAEAMGEVANDPMNRVTAYCKVCGMVPAPITRDVAMCGACYQSLGDLPPIVKVANPDGVHRVWHFADGSTSQLASNRIIELGRAAIAPEVRLVRKVTV